VISTKSFSRKVFRIAALSAVVKESHCKKSIISSKFPLASVRYCFTKDLSQSESSLRFFSAGFSAKLISVCNRTRLQCSKRFSCISAVSREISTGFDKSSAGGINSKSKFPGLFSTASSKSTVISLCRLRSTFFIRK